MKGWFTAKDNLSRLMRLHWETKKTNFFSICISETHSAAEKVAHPTCFTMLSICWIFLAAVKSQISYLPRYSEIATFIPLKAAEAKFFGLWVEDKAFLLQKLSIRSSNTNTSAAAQAMMLSQQSWQFSSTLWSSQRWSTALSSIYRKRVPRTCSPLTASCRHVEPAQWKEPALGPGQGLATPGRGPSAANVGVQEHGKEHQRGTGRKECAETGLKDPAFIWMASPKEREYGRQTLLWKQEAWKKIRAGGKARAKTPA